jgi:protein-tyrosine phosphatase
MNESSRWKIPSTTPVSNLYLGTCFGAKDEKWLQDHNIALIIDLGSVSKRDEMKSKIKRVKYEVKDTEDQDLQKCFTETYELIETVLQEKKGVLVHCVAGISRSPAVVISYLMKKKRWSLALANKNLSEHRGIIAPNFGFLQQLEKLEQELFKKDN